MKLHQLHEFIAIADCGSIRAAARFLGLSQPALTKSLHRLEEEMHVQLVVRTTHGVELTAYGNALLGRARLIQAESQKIHQEIAQMRGEKEGTLTVGLSPTVATLLLPPALNQFRKDYPNVRLNIVGGLYHTHLPEIRAGTMEFAIGPIPAEGLGPDFSSEPLFFNNTVIACRKSHYLRDATRLADLQDADWALYGRVRHGPGASIVEAFQQAGLSLPRIVVQCSSIAGLIALVAHSDILCILAREMLDQEPLCNGLHSITIQESLPRYLITLFRKASSPLSPAAAHLATLLRRQSSYLNQERDAPIVSNG